MAHTFSIVDRDVQGSRFVRVVDITIVDNYVTNGWPIAPVDLGLGVNGTIKFLTPQGGEDGYALQWDEVNGKLKVFTSAAAGSPGTELTNASTALQTKKIRVKAEGIGSPG